MTNVLEWAEKNLICRVRYLKENNGDITETILIREKVSKIRHPI